jgi:hypothetical protein
MLFNLEQFVAGLRAPHFTRFLLCTLGYANVAKESRRYVLFKSR